LDPEASVSGSSNGGCFLEHNAVLHRSGSIDAISVSDADFIAYRIVQGFRILILANVDSSRA
jgi:hypothetical protein